MKFIKKYIIRIIAAMSLCVIAASCSQDEFGLIPEHERSLKLTASVEGMVTRADDNGSWTNGDIIRVRIGSYPWVGKYMLNSDGTVQEILEALAWPCTEDFVSAWYPFLDDGTEVSINDQSEGYHEYDFLQARTERMMNYQEFVHLKFKHQMAKVRCELIKGEGLTEEEFKSAKVSYYGFPGVKFSEQGISGTGSLAYVTPASDNSALLVPQDMTGQPFIKIDLIVTINNVPTPKTLVYTPQETMNLVAGMAYTFNIKLKKDSLEIQTFSGAWTESLENTVPTADKYQIFLTGDTGALGELEFSSNVTEKSPDTRDGSVRCLEVLGDYFTISYKVTTDNCHLGIFFDNEKTENTLNEVSRTYNEINQVGYYKFTYKIVSLISDSVFLKTGDHIEVGDILFQDGKWACNSIPKKIYEGKKTPVGIVFKIGAGSVNDDPTYYGWDKNREIRGYALALNDAFSTPVIWGPTTQLFKTQENIGSNYSGLYITNRIKEVLPQKKLTISDFPAFQKVEEYKVNASAPEGSSGWYLPSEQQLADIYPLFKHPQRRQWLSNAGGGFFMPAGYWSAVEAAQTLARAKLFNYESTSSLGSEGKKRNYYVRAVLTF